MRRALIACAVLALVGALAFPAAAAPAPWDGWVHAPLKTAQPFDWSAPDQFFTGSESADLAYLEESDAFEGRLNLDGFMQAGPYVLSVNSTSPTSMAGISDCTFWTAFAAGYGETFVGGVNGCWAGEPYVDVRRFMLSDWDLDGDYEGTVTFDVPFPDGSYEAKFFVKYDAWAVHDATGTWNNIVMMNDMTGDPRYGKVTQPKGFNYDVDLDIDGSPVPTTVNLVRKNGEPAWAPVTGPGFGEPWGTLTYLARGPSFVYSFATTNCLSPNAPYTLVQYNDPWPGAPAQDLAALTTDGSGMATTGGWRSLDLGRDLLTGVAKMWFVPSGYVNTTTDRMTGFSLDFLLEGDWIVYDDTDVP